MGAITHQQQAGLLHGRQMVLLVTIGLHALVIALLMTMKMGVAVFDPPPLIAQFLTPDKPVEQPPPELEPDTPTPQTRITLQIPDPLIDIPVDDLPPTALVVTPADIGPPTPVTEGPPAGGVAQIPPTSLQFSVVRPTDDYYPSRSLSLQEQGTTVVRLCVTPAGKLDGPPAVEASSGSPRLDAAAIAWAREGLRFTPATRDGVAIAACKGFRVNFRLN